METMAREISKTFERELKGSLGIEKEVVISNTASIKKENKQDDDWAQKLVGDEKEVLGNYKKYNEVAESLLKYSDGSMDGLKVVIMNFND